VPAAGFHLTSVTGCGATFAGNTITTAPITADCTVRATFSLNFAVFGDEGVSITGTSRIDSYHSVKTDHDDDDHHGREGAVGTNSKEKGAITLSGSSSVHGDVWVGPGGDPKKVISVRGHRAVITGKRAALESPRDMTLETVPGGGSPIVIAHGSVMKTGVYRASAIALRGSDEVTIDGDVTLIVAGDVELSGNAHVILLPGASLALYVDGNVTMSNVGFTSKLKSARAIVIHGLAGCASVRVSGRGDFYGIIRAPRARLEISGEGDFFGSLLARRVMISGTANVHYDESLQNRGD
jgi:hypothetical protein